MNKKYIIIIGKVKDEPTLRYTAGGLSICTFYIQTEESIDLIRCIAFAKIGEDANYMLHEYMPVKLKGYFKDNTWKDKTGTERTVKEFICQEIYFQDEELPF